MSSLKICPQCGAEYPADARFCEIDGTALRAAGSDRDMIGSIIADRYCILKKLGEGGMGQVYLAEHVKMGRKVALKVMHPGMAKDVDAVSRFNREAARSSKINHPNVAAVYDFGETADGIIFLATEFIDGPSLTRVIEQSGALPVKRAAEITRQVAAGLAIAHDMGIVHRDLKPDNIMVAKARDGSDLVKIVDFGIAKVVGSAGQKVTKAGLVVGTPEYMSPEQLVGDRLDGRSDIYSLALVAFNMLTGALPFPSDSAQEAMIMRLTDKPKPLAEMRSDIAWPADVQTVMDKALERDSSLRYQSATEFGRDLTRAIDRMPETVVGEMGTQMLQVPPTRVGGDGVGRSSNPVGGGTVAVPAPIAVNRPTMATAPAPRSRPGLGSMLSALVRVPIDAISAGSRALKQRMSPRSSAPIKRVAAADPATVPFDNPTTRAHATAADVVECSVYTRKTAAPKERFLVQVFAHAEPEAAVVERRALEVDEKANRRAVTTLELEIQRGTRLTFHLALPGFVVDDPVQELVWRGRADSVSFDVTAPELPDGSDHIGTLTAIVNGVPIGRLRFTMRVATAVKSTDRRSRPRGHSGRYFRKAFISYAAENRSEVLKRVQMLRQFEIEFFQDVVRLDPGAVWEDRLRNEIEDSDVFLLFWSSAARRSAWVARELEHALERQARDRDGLPEIVPVIIEGPPPPAPPPQLAHLHFDDYLLYFMSPTAG